MADQPSGNGTVHNSNGHGTNGEGAHLPFGASRVTDIDRLESLIGNVLSSRVDFFRQMLDPRRSIEDECGYPAVTQAVGVETYKQLYDREAVATRVVQVLAKESWQVTPLVYEDERPDKSTEFEEAWDEMEVTLQGGKSWHTEEHGSTIWEHLIRADILSGIGHFGVLLLGIDDGRNLAEPVEGVMTFNRAPACRGWYPTAIHDCLPSEQERDVLEANGWEPSGYERWLSHAATQARESALRNGGVRNDHWGEGPQSSGMDSKHPSDISDRASPNGPQTKDGSKPREPSQLTGTDLQYAWQGAMPPSAMAGTDQQYFGVQFGPSEAMKDAPAKGKRKRLLFLRAFDESLVQIVRYEWNVRNPRFGMPVMYRITLNDPRETHSGVGLPLATVYVHWSRVIHIADNLGSSEIFGVPRMRPVLNRLLDLRKLYSGSAEMYWRGAFPGLSLETNPQMGGDVKIDASKMKDMMEQYMNGLQRYLLMTGMSAKTLSPTVVDPSPQIATQIEAICIQLGVPVRVFKGSERGELASSQDDSAWNDRLRARQSQYLTPRVIAPFVDRLIMLNVLPEPEQYVVEWPDLDSLSDQEKATVFNTRVTAYSAALQGGLESIFTPIDMMTKLDYMDEEEAEAILEDAQEAVEQKQEEEAQQQQEQMALQQEQQEERARIAEEHGFMPNPPSGYGHAQPLPGQMPPGQPGQPPPQGGPPGKPPMPQAQGPPKIPGQGPPTAGGAKPFAATPPKPMATTKADPAKPPKPPTGNEMIEEEQLLSNCGGVGGKPGPCKTKGEQAEAGDTVTILGKLVHVVELGHWAEMKGKYPEEAQAALEQLPPHVPESKLGRTWVLRDGDGKHFLVGKAGMNLFAKHPVSNALRELLWNCGGKGSGVPGPCAGGGGADEETPKGFFGRMRSKVSSVASAVTALAEHVPVLKGAVDKVSSAVESVKDKVKDAVEGKAMGAVGTVSTVMAAAGTIASGGLLGAVTAGLGLSVPGVAEVMAKVGSKMIEKATGGVLNAADYDAPESDLTDPDTLDELTKWAAQELTQAFVEALKGHGETLVKLIRPMLLGGRRRRSDAEQPSVVNAQRWVVADSEHVEPDDQEVLYLFLRKSIEERLS